MLEIIEAGVRVFCYLTDQEVCMDDETSSFMGAVRHYASGMERERARQRTLDALQRKARQGYVTGGKAYGYENRDVLGPDGKRLHVLRVINPAEAAIVKRIFDDYAAGQGITKIAKGLNDEGIPGPRRSELGWSPCAVREILHHSIYRGELIYGRMEKIVRGGTKKRRPRPESEWIRIKAPDLQIISAALWESVKTRLVRLKEKSRPRVRDIESKYLLTSVARCAHCGGPMMVVGPGTSRRTGRYYACSYHKKRGSSICQNGVMAEQETLDQALLKGLADVLHEKVLDEAIEQALRQLRGHQDTRLDRASAITRELSLIEAYETRLVEAIKKGQGELDPLLTSLANEEARKKALIIELDQVQHAEIPEWDTARLRRDMKQRLADLPTLLSSHISEARKLLKTLFEEGLKCMADGSTMTVSGTGNFLNLLSSSSAHLAWCPQREQRAFARL